MDLYEKIMCIQNELKAPKTQYNSFGKYSYRSLEDIQEAVKPLLKKYKCFLVISDDVQEIGGSNYIRTEARLYNSEGNDVPITVSAFAREAVSQKGMADAQITGATSSYARKYCLNGLFCIDDTKDADSMKPEKPNKKPVKEPVKKQKKPTLSKESLKWLQNFCKDKMITGAEDKKEFQKHYGFDPYKTSELEFKEIKNTILEDYNEV